MVDKYNKRSNELPLKPAEDMGGTSSSNPSSLRRWLTSKMMTRLSSEKNQQKVRRLAEIKRQKSGLPHQLEYFHQTDDAYSHLTVQLLQRLVDRYDIQLACHLVSAEQSDNTPEPQLLQDLSGYDAQLVAPYYGLEFPQTKQAPSVEIINNAQRVFANMSNESFIAHAHQVSQAAWQQSAEQLDELAKQFGQQTAQQTQQRIDDGNARRTQLKHYSGAMFFYGNEWYWGVDRLYHLESRLIELGLRKSNAKTNKQSLIAARPQVKQKVLEEPLNGLSNLTLEIYPSLRSPYSAVVFDQTLELANATGVKLKVLPVLPMVMRGVPATVEKGKYILFDAGREARAADVAFGPCADPIGKPTLQAYSLCQWAEQQGKLNEFISTFLKCAWVDAIDTNKLSGLKKAIARSGLDWFEAQKHLGNKGWEEQMEANRLQMYEAGLWGVPSFRLLNQSGEVLLKVWGQDRLWLVAQRLLELAK